MMLRGLAPFSTEVRLVHKREVLDRIGRAAAHLEPLLELDRVPEHFAVIHAVAVGKDIECDIEALRMPLPAWDTWLVTIKSRRPGPLTLDVGLPYLGHYDPAAREFRHESPPSWRARFRC